MEPNRRRMPMAVRVNQLWSSGNHHSVAPRKPFGFLVCQLREDWAMSSMVNSAFQPSSLAALEASQ